jgi:hypothetical protein
VDGSKRRNGEVVYSWTFNDTIFIKTMGNIDVIALTMGYKTWFSQVLLSENYYIYLEKAVNRVSFVEAADPCSCSINTFMKSNFTQAQLGKLGGFYIRSIMASSRSPHIFYIKFPLSLVTISYTGGTQF